MIRTRINALGHSIRFTFLPLMMKSYRLFICLSLTVLIGLIAHSIALKRNENISDPTKRFTHAIINGEVRGHGKLPVHDRHAYLLVELRLTRDDRPRPIARTRVKFSQSNQTKDDRFQIAFKLKYPLVKISPFNTYTLSARIRDGNNQLLFVGDLPVPITEQREKQAKHLIIEMIETRKTRSD